MLERLEGLPYGIEGLRALGKVSKDDFAQVFKPCVETARRQSRPMRFLYHFGAKFEGFTPSGAWEGMKPGLYSVRFFEGCAIVSNSVWLRASSKLLGFLLPCPVRAFSESEYDAAIAWLGSLPSISAASHTLLSDGVLVIEVSKMLHAHDFDALVLAADTFLKAGGELHGLVIHAHDYTGWENLSHFFRHLRFVNDEHKRVARVAIAGDKGVTSLAPQLARHFVGAEAKTFGYDARDAAVAWARMRRPAARRATELDTTLDM